MRQRTSTVWSSFIGEVFGMISKLLPQRSDYPVHPPRVNLFICWEIYILALSFVLGM